MDNSCLDRDSFDLERVGLYYYKARYYDPDLGRFITPDPAHDGLNWYCYCSNNPVNFVDPTGLAQQWYQKALTNIINFASSKSDKIRDFVQQHARIDATRNVYKGKEITDTWNSPEYSGTDTYFKANLSLKVGGIPLNNIQLQLTVDYPGGSQDNNLANESTHDAKIGRSGATKPWITDTLQIEDAKFFHRNWGEGRKPGSLGCPISENSGDEREIMDILRKDLKFTNEQTVKFNVTKPNQGKVKENLK